MEFLGIDSRQIKCCCNNPKCRQTGVSFEEMNGRPILRFHFNEYVDLDGNKSLDQKTRIMVLNKKNITELIHQLNTELKNL